MTFNLVLKVVILSSSSILKLCDEDLNYAYPFMYGLQCISCLLYKITHRNIQNLPLVHATKDCIDSFAFVSHNSCFFKNLVVFALQHLIFLSILDD